MQGFYAVYKGVFRRIADEEMDEDGTSLPGFGKHLVTIPGLVKTCCINRYLNN